MIQKGQIWRIYNMATDFNNPEQLTAWKQRALQKGYTEDKINAFLAEKGVGVNTPTAGSVPTSETNNMMIDPNMAAVAQLVLPKNTAEAVKNALQIQQTNAKEQQNMTETKDKEESAKALKNQALEVAAELKKLDYGKITGSKGPGAWNIPFTENPLISGAPAQETLNKYKQLKSLLSLDNIKYLKGTGQISDKEQALLEGAASSLDTNLSNKAFGRELDKVLKSLGGKNAPEQPLNKRMEETNPLINFLYGASSPYFRDLAVGQTLKGKDAEGMYNSFKGTMDQANQALDKAQEIDATDPEGAKRLRDIANQSLTTIQEESSGIQKLFSSKIDEPYTKRSAGVGFELGTSVDSALGASKLLQSILTAGGKNQLFSKAGKEAIDTLVSAPKSTGISGKIVDTVEGIKSLSPTRALARKQAEAAAKSTIKPKIDTFIKAGEEASKFDPTIAKEFSSIKPTLSNIKTTSDLLEAMQTWGGQTYTKAGDVRSAAKARMFNELYKNGLEILKTEAPEVYKYRSLLRYSFQLPKNASKLLWRATLGRVLVGP